MRYSEVSYDNQDYIALVDDLIYFDQEGTLHKKETVLEMIKPKAEMTSEQYEALDKCISSCECAGLDEIFRNEAVAFNKNVTDMFTFGFLYKFVGPDILYKLGEHRPAFAEMVSRCYLSCQFRPISGIPSIESFMSQWLLGSKAKSSVLTKDSKHTPCEFRDFQALTELAGLKEEVVAALQANLEQFHYVDKTLGLYDFSNASIHEANKHERKLEIRLLNEMVNNSVSNFNSQTENLDDYVQQLKEDNKLESMALSLSQDGFTSIPRIEQLLVQSKWVANAVPVVSYTLTMDYQGKIVDFDIIKADQFDQSQLASAIKDMQGKYSFDSLAFFADNDWTTPWDYAGSIRADGIPYMFNDHFHFFDDKEAVKGFLSSLKFAQSSSSTFVCGADPDRQLCNEYERSKCACTPFVYSYSLSDEEKQQMLQKGVTKVSAKNKVSDKNGADLLLDSRKKALIFKGQTFVVFQSALDIKEHCQLFSFNFGGRTIQDSYRDGCGYITFECSPDLFKQMGPKGKMMTNFSKVNTTKNLFKHAVQTLNLNNKFPVTSDVICGHLLSVYCAMVLRQFVQFHSDPDGVAISLNLMKDVEDRFCYGFIEYFVPPQEHNEQQSMLELVLNGRVVFRNPFWGTVNRKEQEASAERIINIFQSMGFAPEHLDKENLECDQLAALFNLPLEVCKGVVLENLYNDMRQSIAANVKKQFVKQFAPEAPAKKQSAFADKGRDFPTDPFSALLHMLKL